MGVRREDLAPNKACLREEQKIKNRCVPTTPAAKSPERPAKRKKKLNHSKNCRMTEKRKAISQTKAHVQPREEASGKSDVVLQGIS